MSRVTLLMATIFCYSVAFGQSRFTLTATVVDEITKNKLPFATFTLLDSATKNLVGGGVSDENGYVVVESSTQDITVQVDYIGYETKSINLELRSKRTQIGTVTLTPKENQLAGIDLVGRRSDVEIRLDKRVYNIGQNLNAKGTNVSDVLENIPSLSIDLDGNLELRGNTNVRILIDGKPSGLVGMNGIDALADLPAESVDRVEIITAPSARYQAEGSSGIVNIILAKNNLKGLNGVFNVSAGKFESYGSNASLNYKSGKFNFFTNSGYRDETNIGGAFQDNYYKDNSDYDQFIETRSFDRRRRGTNINIGTDFNPTDKTKFTLSYVHNKRDGDDQTINFQNHFLASNPVTQSRRSEIEKDTDINEQLSLSITHKFNDKGHKLDLTIQKEKNIEDELADLQTQQYLPTNILGLLEENNTADTQKQFLAQLDYVWPIDKNTQFEAGYRATNENQDATFVVQNEDEMGLIIIDESLTNFLDFKQEVHALYTQFGKKWNSLSLLTGLRYEHTSTNIIQKVTQEDNNRSFGDFFPTINIGLELSDTENITIGYNRRISRPRSRSLNPFQSRSSETSFFRGNPYLKPSYSNGVDVGYLRQFKKVTLNGSVYFRRTEGPENRISVETGDVVEVNGVSTKVVERFPINLGRSDQFGVEANSSVRWSTKWRTNLSFNFFNKTEVGDYQGRSFDNTNRSWTGSFRNNLSLPANINTQINVWFRGPSQSAFGKRKAFGGLNIGLSKDVINNNATININFSDVFNTSIFKWETNTGTILTQGEYQRRKPVYKFTFTYRFRQDKERQRNGSNYESSGGFEL